MDNNIAQIKQELQVLLKKIPSAGAYESVTLTQEVAKLSSEIRRQEKAQQTQQKAAA